MGHIIGEDARRFAQSPIEVDGIFQQSLILVWNSRDRSPSAARLVVVTAQKSPYTSSRFTVYALSLARRLFAMLRLSVTVLHSFIL